MQLFLDSCSFLTTDQLHTYMAMSGADSSNGSVSARDASGEAQTTTKSQSKLVSESETVVLLAMRPTCARNDYQASLATQGFKIITVDDAEQGLHVLKETVPDLVVVEPELEGGSGDRLLDVIQREMQADRIPVFVVSATANRSAIFRIAKFNIDDFAVLPMSAGAFTIRVLKLLSRLKT